MRSAEQKPRTFTQSARRAQIIESAIDVIAEAGWAQTSIRKIADRVGVAMSAVLYHFGTKDNLVDAIIEHMYRSALAVVVPAVDAESTAAGKLTAYIRATIEYYDAHRVHLAALSQLASSYRPSDGRPFDELGVTPALAEDLTSLDAPAILRSGQLSGEFGDFPVESVAMAISGAGHALVYKFLREPDFDAHRYGEDLIEIFGRVVGARR
ncbi:TetR/AcrR family transcriptional regulator [Mycolicibacterium baixiangningiae]|uniref:TetR/AcrR family transcriptional regulator n=1 Tax=Mycolicibacterium baixiangningiae TaxID=2761578 RepID=UPI001865D7FE|nr:TetR/AcrR family transcriptional regulator [Mycolicibacterium baixiangningiae]